MSALANLLELVHEGLEAMECKVYKSRYQYDASDESCECWTCIHVRKTLAALGALADEHAKCLPSSSLALVKAMLDDKFIVKEK